MKTTVYLLGALLFSLGCQSTEKDIPTETRLSAPPATPVSGFIVDHQEMEEQIEATGNLIPNEHVTIRSEISGRLVELHLTEGAYVKKDKLLAKIDDRDLKAQANRLEIDLQLAIKEADRGKQLLAINGITQEEYDRLVNRISEIEADKNINAVAQSKTEILAPFSGILGLRQISPGAYITPADILIDLQQINPIKVEFDVPEKFIKDVKIGQSLDFSVAGFSDIFKSKVFAISTDISPQTRTFKVRGRSLNPRNQLKPGQFAKITLVTRVNDEAIMVPTDAVIPILNGQQVFVANKGRAISTLVETGTRHAEFVQITSGLSPNDTIIISGLLGLSDGRAIVVNETNQIQNPSE